MFIFEKSGRPLASRGVQADAAVGIADLRVDAFEEPADGIEITDEVITELAASFVGKIWSAKFTAKKPAG